MIFFISRLSRVEAKNIIRNVHLVVQSECPLPLAIAWVHQLENGYNFRPNYCDSAKPRIVLSHYANMSVQYTAVFHGCKNGNFQMKKCEIFLIFAQNIDRGYTLEPPH